MIENNYFYLKTLNKMGCNCKKNVNKKYIEGELDFEEAYKISGFSKVVNAIVQFFFGLLISAILIVGII